MVATLATLVSWLINSHFYARCDEPSLSMMSSDIVFVDALMPHVSGLQVLEQLARQGTKSYVVTMSGSPQSLDQVERLARKLELNLIGVLEKPFRLDDLKYILDGL
jgi:DNA-binding NtrC family response regulator